jgi:hypothetical protein
MNRTSFEKLVDDFLAECKATLVKKGDEYSKTDNVLENFERTARDYGVSVTQSWGSHFDKHVSAIRNYCKSGEWINEPIRERIKDAVNYLLLLLAHVHIATPRSSETEKHDGKLEPCRPYPLLDAKEFEDLLRGRPNGSND